MDSHPSEKKHYTITSATEGDKPVIMTVWTASDLKNYPVKMEVPDTAIGSSSTITFKNINLTKPDANHFEALSGSKSYSNIQTLVQTKAIN